jgi:ketosteroid isomerase-like protein
MSVYEKWSGGVEERNAEAMIACLHEDFVFVRHQSGTEMNKAQMSEMLRGFMASDQVVVRSQRCLYENDEVMVEHSVMDFADGSTEAIIGFNQLKDGLIFRTETGATPVSR